MISDLNEDTYTALELKSMTSDLYDTFSQPFIPDLLETPARLLILNMRIHQSTGRCCSERRRTKQPILSSVGGATYDWQ
ncbi:hypothetical protein G5714_000212 [Onychostoma macrolepis]|uniref:Uncharacterized protein n=1 Tax=Onychostoma macrolepis TaxID=369639 RepID=A0A7J6DGF9_9TELE|nr:hypothetical protein G5714_000212 [Onychostoma macrolepis]